MTSIDKNTQAPEQTVEEWLAIRKEAGLQIDPETADVYWCHAQILDPYGIDPNLPKEYDQIGRVYFARSPKSDVWVEFNDLPEATIERLRQRMEDGDFDKSSAEQGRDHIAPLTFEQARADVQVALRLHLETADMEIEGCSQLPDGRFQFTVREYRPRAD
jgi:hypothetical protein